MTDPNTLWKFMIYLRFTNVKALEVQFFHDAQDWNHNHAKIKSLKQLVQIRHITAKQIKSPITLNLRASSTTPAPVVMQKKKEEFCV